MRTWMWGLALLAAIGCDDKGDGSGDEGTEGEQEGEEGEEEGDEGEVEGDEDDEDGEGDDTDDPPDETAIPAECEQLIACAAEVDPDHADLYEEAYGPGGECYEDGSASAELACIEICEAEVAAFSLEDPTVEACWPEGSPDAYLLFEEIPQTWDATAVAPCDLGEIDKLEEASSGFGEQGMYFFANEPGPGFEAWGQVYHNFKEGWFAGYDGELTCVFSGRAFSCDGTDEYGDIDWEVSGSFGEGFEDLEMEVYLEVDTGDDKLDGSYSCTYEGEPR